MGTNAIIVVATVLAIAGGAVAIAMAGNEPTIPEVITLEPAADQERVGATPADAGASADDPAAAAGGAPIPAVDAPVAVGEHGPCRRARLRGPVRRRA